MTTKVKEAQSTIEDHIHTISRQQSRTLEAQRRRFEHAWTRTGLTWRRNRLVSWGIVGDRIQRHFDAASTASRVDRWFDHLYVFRDDERRTVQLFFGAHPVWTLSATSVEVERGASLVISQNVMGSVIVLFYPFQTSSVQRIKPRVIWGVFDGPEELSDAVLLRIVEEFLRYSRVSSLLFVGSWWERHCVDWLEHRSRLFEGTAGGLKLWGATIATLIAGSLATASIYLAWALDTDKRGWLEPYAGLMTLVTGWIAVRVQLGLNAVDKAMAKEEAERVDSQVLKNPADMSRSEQ